MPKPSSTSILSLTTSSCAIRLVASGTPPSSLRITSTLRPATVAPFCAIHSLTAASSCLPVEACWPVMGRIRPILNGGPDWALAAPESAAAASRESEKPRARRRCMGSPSKGSRDSRDGASGGNADIRQPKRPPPIMAFRPAATERGLSMTIRTRPPFRADHVGSFLRPKRLLDARERKARGEITAEQLREVEDEAIAEIVSFQEDVGLRSVTDGEFRRTYFHIDFLEQLGGVKTDIPVTIKKPDGSEELAPPVIRVIDKVRHAKDVQKADFEYLQSQLSAGHTPKV